MSNKKFKLLYVDPPWKFSNKNTGGSMKSGADAQYPTMTIEQLKALDVPSICEDNCLLVMWWVGSQPQEAIDLCQAWGFTIKNMNGFVWNKLTKHGLPYFGMGFYTRAGSESAIIAARGKASNLIMNHSVRAVESRPVGRHSAKPAVFRKECVQLMGNVPRLEMFARQSVPGWSSWGDEVPDSIEIPTVKLEKISGLIHGKWYTIETKTRQYFGRYESEGDRFYIDTAPKYVERKDVISYAEVRNK